MRAAVIVLGDLGRSPRMQYHALSLAENGAEVHLVGYAGERPWSSLLEHPRVHIHALSNPEAVDRTASRTLPAVALRTARRLGQLLRTGARLPALDLVLVQNPPAIPTLIAASFLAWARSAPLIIDWHNFSAAVWAASVQAPPFTIRVLRFCERSLGRLGDAHLCVSAAMAEELQRRWRLDQVSILYDRPASPFNPTPLDERHALFLRLARREGIGAEPTTRRSADAARQEGSVTELSVPAQALVGDVESAFEALGDRGGSGAPVDLACLRPYLRLRARRPAVLVSPTSWSDDEDLGLLLDAVELLEAELDGEPQTEAGRGFPELWIFVTGKGPRRSEFVERLGTLQLKWVRIFTPWLPFEDYFRLVGSADLGLCFHRSSSGLDLPMKVADMFGAGVPVCAVDYGETLREAVREGETGLLFRDAKTLMGHVLRLFRHFPDHAEGLDELRKGVLSSTREGWNEAWRETMLPLLNELQRSRT